MKIYDLSKYSMKFFLKLSIIYNCDIVEYKKIPLSIQDKGVRIIIIDGFILPMERLLVWSFWLVVYDA